jgi:hypothetical protein
MVRKLVFSAVFVLGLVTLAVSAQQPPSNNEAGSQGRQSQAHTPLDSLPTQPTPPPGFPNRFAGQKALGQLDWVAVPRGMQAENASLAHQSEALVHQLAKAKGEDREKVKTKLAEALEKQFDLRQKRHQAEIAALEAQVNQLKELVQKRQENRREIISKRLDQLVRDAEGLGW